MKSDKTNDKPIFDPYEQWVEAANELAELRKACYKMLAQLEKQTSESIKILEDALARKPENEEGKTMADDSV